MFLLLLITKYILTLKLIIYNDFPSFFLYLKLLFLGGYLNIDPQISSLFKKN